MGVGAEDDERLPEVNQPFIEISRYSILGLSAPITSVFKFCSFISIFGTLKFTTSIFNSVAVRQK